MANSSTLKILFLKQFFQLEKSFRIPGSSMDDILLVHAEEWVLQQMFAKLQIYLQNYSLCIAPEKVQRYAPFSYVGTIIL